VRQGHTYIVTSTMDFVIFKLTCLWESRELMCLYLHFSTMPLHSHIFNYWIPVLLDRIYNVEYEEKIENCFNRIRWRPLSVKSEQWHNYRVITLSWQMIRFWFPCSSFRFTWSNVVRVLCFCFSFCLFCFVCLQCCFTTNH
jgi:hypothetical protein